MVAELPWTRTKYTPAERVVGTVRVSPRRVESGRSKSSRSIVGSCPCQAGRIGQEGEVVSVYAWGPVKSIRVHNWFCSKIQVVPPAIALPATWTRRQSHEDEPRTFISGSDDSLNHPVRSNSSTWPLATYSTPSTAALRPRGALCDVDTFPFETQGPQSYGSAPASEIPDTGFYDRKVLLTQAGSPRPFSGCQGHGICTSDKETTS